MLSTTFLPLLQISQEDGLTGSELLANIPHDPAAIVVYLLVAFSIGLVLWSGRRGHPRKSAGEQ